MSFQRTFFLLPLAAGLLAASCGPLEWMREAGEADLTPPFLTGVRTLGPEEVELIFDEECTIDLESVVLQPAELLLHEARPEGCSVVLRVSAQEPGREYLLEATAADARGNSLLFMARFYGFNPRLPAVRINEFTTRGSDTHPDLLELAVLSEGNLGGLTLYQGTPGNWQDRLVFPAFEVRPGDFVLVHFKPQGIAEEVDETQATDLSGGLDACDAAFDFWVPEGSGLSGNNGVLTLYDRPGGGLVDGVLYSDRTSDSDERYRGFGTLNVLERAEELVADGGWRIAGERVRPEDAVSPEGSTATRSLCRSSDSADTDGREDWHIVPTRGSTFGAPNSDQVYVP